MEPNDVKAEIAIKTLELERAREAGRSMEEIMSLYKELKQLHYEHMQARLSENDDGRFERA